MDILVKRRIITDKSTIGDLYVDGVKECYTLEDTQKAKKVFGKTAIPIGVYNVAITHSARFDRPLPLLLDVPGFTGIRIHPGNNADNTEGCILVGQTKSEDFIGNSALAFRALFAKMQRATTPITLTIE